MRVLAVRGSSVGSGMMAFPGARRSRLIKDFDGPHVLDEILEYIPYRSGVVRSSIEPVFEVFEEACSLTA